MAFVLIRKNWTKILLIAMLILALPFCLIYLTLSIPQARRIILNYTESTVNQYIAGEMRIKDFETDLFTRLILYGVTAGSGYPNEDTLSVKQIEIRWRMPALFKKRVELHKITIKNVNASAQRDKNGKFHFPLTPKPQAKKPKEPQTPVPKKRGRQWEFAVNSIALKNAHVSFEDLKFHAKLYLHTEILLSLKQDTVNVKIMADSGRLSTPVIEWQIDTIFAAGQIQGRSRLHLENLLISVDSTLIDVHGIIPFLENEFWDLSAFASVSLKQAALPVINGGTIDPYSRLEMFLRMKGLQLQPSGELRLTSGKTLVGNIEIDTMHLHADFSMPESLKTRFMFLTDAGSAQGNASVALGGLLTDTLFVKKYQLDAILRELNIPKILRWKTLPPPEQTLKANAIVNAAGNGENIFSQLPQEADINIYFDLPKPYAIEPAELNISLRGKDWSANGLLGMLNKLDGKGSVCKDSISGQINALILNPQLISAPFIDPPINGRLSLRSELNGPLFSPNVNASITSPNLSWNGINADTLYAKAALREGRLLLTESRLELNTDMNAQNAIRSPVKGRVEAVIEASGAIDDITVYADFTAKHMAYSSVKFDIIKGSAVYNSNTVKWEDVKLKNLDFSILSAGKVNFGGGPLSFYANAFLERGKNPYGHLESAGEIYNDSISAILRGRQINTAAILQFTRFPVPADLENLVNRNQGTIELDLAVGGPRLSPEANLSATLIQHINNELSATLKGNFLFSNDTINGNGKLEASISDFTDTNSISFTVNLPLQSEDAIRKFSSGARIQINSAGFPIGQVVSAACDKINTDAAMFIDGQIKFQQNAWTLSGNTTVQIDTFFHAGKKLSIARLPIKAAIGGTVENPLISIEAKRGKIEYHDIVTQIVNIEAAVSNRQITVNAMELTFGQDGYALISAYYPLAKKRTPLLGMRVDYEIRRFPLPLLSSVLPKIEITSGQLNGRGKFAFGDSIVSYGLLRIDSLIITQQKINRPIGPIYATVTHNNQWISLPYLRGRLGGPFSIQGRMACTDSSIETISIFAKGKNIRFRYGNNIDLGLGAVELFANGHDSKIDSITGVINLGETRYYQNLAILDILEQLLTIRTEQMYEIPPILGDARLHLDLRLKSNAIVITSAGRMHLTGRLIFEGTAAQPTVDGEVRLVQAHIRYLDRRFNIGDEYIRRMRPVAIDRLISPVNDEAIRSFIFDDQRDFIIGVALKGSLFEPKALLTSHPPLKTEHIVNLLTSGTIATIPSSLYSPVEIASVYAGGWVAWELMYLTDITFIDINGNFAEFTEERGPRLTLFQRFTEKLYGSYQLQLGKPEDQALSVIYRFMPRFFISGTAGTRNSGAGLWFFFRR